MMMMAFKDIEGSLSFFGKTTIIMGISATLVLLFLAIFDYVNQRYNFEKNMRMTKQDIKNENKNNEGDPINKTKIKEKQRQKTMKRMMSEVTSTNEVITK